MPGSSPRKERTTCFPHKGSPQRGLCVSSSHDDGLLCTCSKATCLRTPPRIQQRICKAALPWKKQRTGSPQDSYPKLQRAAQALELAPSQCTLSLLTTFKSHHHRHSTLQATLLYSMRWSGLKNQGFMCLSMGIRWKGSLHPCRRSYRGSLREVLSI